MAIIETHRLTKKFGEITAFYHRLSARHNLEFYAKFNANINVQHPVERYLKW